MTGTVTRLASASGLSIEVDHNGSIRRIDLGDIVVNLFIGNVLEGGLSNLYLRKLGDAPQVAALLGPGSATRFRCPADEGAMLGVGEAFGVRYTVRLVLAQQAPAWFWHVELENAGAESLRLDLIHTQDVGLAPYGALRLNEYYVSQYIDHTALEHAERGFVVASRQNQAVGTRHPWSVFGSLRRGVAYATDALQFHGLASRVGATPPGLVDGLPARRLQHEHSMVALQDEPVTLAPAASLRLGFFGSVLADHPEATSAADLTTVDRTLALPESKAEPELEPAASIAARPVDEGPPVAASLFNPGHLLPVLDAEPDDLETWFGPERRHAEHDAAGRLLSFFAAAERHVVLRAKELAVLRPHGHLLRTGSHATPDETALTSTVWMAGSFHSMLTQGHVSINRFLSTVHGYLGLFRSQGLRVFVELAGRWQLLDVPSVFEMTPTACHWYYRHADGLIEVHSAAHSEPHAMSLSIDVVSGPATRFLISQHVALGGDDGSNAGAVRWSRDGDDIRVVPDPASEMSKRFPEGSVRIALERGTRVERIGGDEHLFLDGQAREQPYLCIVTAASDAIGMRWSADLVRGSADIPAAGSDGAQRLGRALSFSAPPATALEDELAQLADVVPWFSHNALIHYLAPRGLEQYSGGGWGTRDVCQGPIELLRAFGSNAPMRDLLLRVMRAQNADGDWPQWFMFFARDAGIRADDSHGDIAFWPVLALAQYLLASGDASILDEPVPFHAARPSKRAAQPSVWRHVLRALALIRRRVVSGTALAAYGHGDWNDALQPADPAMREHMCSAWTVTLHHQTLTTLARALRHVGRGRGAARLDREAAAVRVDFQRLLVVDGVLAGYALFDGPTASETGADVDAERRMAERRISYLLHPRDAATGVHYSVLAMIHAILEDMLDATQTREHLELIRNRLSGPDGVRLFDKPMAYHGGLQRHFQRAESATYFGREIGLMYMHAHLRYAEALAHVGDAEGFFLALCRANPIGIRGIVAEAGLRQSNCYYSSSDAAFADRYDAGEHYARINEGKVRLDGGWRVYSSGAGIAVSLIVRHLLGLQFEAGVLVFDPVLPAALDGLRVVATLDAHEVELLYRVRGEGHGVSALRVNGASLPFARMENPHRRGAVRLDEAVFSKAIVAAAAASPGGGRPMLQVDIGWTVEA